LIAASEKLRRFDVMDYRGLKWEHGKLIIERLQWTETLYPFVSGNHNDREPMPF
jgi:hypothetical protein